MSDIETIALAAVQQRYADLVTTLMEGKTPTRGDLMGHAACIGAKYQTPAIAAVMQKRK